MVETCRAQGLGEESLDSNVSQTRMTSLCVVRCVLNSSTHEWEQLQRQAPVCPRTADSDNAEQAMAFLTFAGIAFLRSRPVQWQWRHGFACFAVQFSPVQLSQYLVFVAV